MFRPACETLAAGEMTSEFSNRHQLRFDPVSSRKSFTTIKDPNCFRPQVEKIERPRNRASNGYRFRDHQTAILRSFEAFELILQTPPNVPERITKHSVQRPEVVAASGEIQTKSESRRIHQYRDCDKAAEQQMVSTLLLRRCDGTFSQKCLDVLLGLNSTRPQFSE